MPGWEEGSYGFHGDDGRRLTSYPLFADRWLPEFGTGDIVGCGIFPGGVGGYYTKNGQYLGMAGIRHLVLQADANDNLGIFELLWRDIGHAIYPVVGMKEKRISHPC